MKGLTEAQIAALRMVEKRNWRAGEPRLYWINRATADRLLRDGLIAELAGSEERHPCRGILHRSPIVDLTPAGRAALAQNGGGDGK